LRRAASAIAAALALSAAQAEPGEELAGGATTVFDASRNAFSFPAANLPSARQTDFFVGNSFFKRNWVEAPASTSARDGLGPHFLARSCAACHLLDGRGALPEPTYGAQLTDQAIQDVRREAAVRIRYQRVPGRFADGTPYELLKPTYAIVEPGYGPLHPDTLVSPRIAPQVIGMGLLEAIREADLLENAKRQAAEGHGVSGRANRVWDVYANDWVIGRFGWKANVGSVAHQVASAFAGDIGITSRHFPRGECTAAQRDCLEALEREAKWRRGRAEAGFDIDQRTLDKVIFYSVTIAVPARRDWNAPQVRRGERVFSAAGCASCHVPRYVTGEHKGVPELSGQTIRPYTDLLLHDMGEGLADGRADFAAGGREWRTPPLWGIGLVSTVNGHTAFLHDGRARNLLEAVLWHGGEAEAAKQRVLKLNPADRAALLRFLNSL
jgi:CxxC motif-containing protein (DUF1111 family)